MKKEIYKVLFTGSIALSTTLSGLTAYASPEISKSEGNITNLSPANAGIN
ncbi:hypothetical protein [Paenibacillus pini]|nr:hypothetical protein [Paenibacillus pini]